MDERRGEQALWWAGAVMGGRCDGRTLGGTGLRTTGKALAQHAAAGIGDLMHSFVTRGIDWGTPIRISYHGA